MYDGERVFVVGVYVIGGNESDWFFCKLLDV